MSWFKRMKRRMRNYTSGADYAGSHQAGSADTPQRHTRARFEATVNRPDRFGGGSWD